MKKGSALIGGREDVLTKDKVSISFYENVIPNFVENELERLYGSIFSSLLQMKTAGRLTEDTHTYVARQGNAITALFLFRLENRSVIVLNEVLTLDGEEIRQFSQHVFYRYRRISAIFFTAVHARTRSFSYPFVSQAYLDDYVLKLPTSDKAYLASLGNSTKKYIQRYLGKLRREQPSFQFKVYEATEIELELINTLCAFNRQRMAEKGRVSMLDDNYKKKIAELAKTCGLLGVMLIDGRICAGVLLSRFGKDYYMHVIAHDPAYNECRLGTLCCYLSICECIKRAGENFHFLWGEADYKYRLGGVRQTLDELMVFRSYAYLVLHADNIFFKVSRYHIRQLKIRLSKFQNHHAFFTRIACRPLAMLRKLKHVMPDARPASIQVRPQMERERK